MNYYEEIKNELMKMKFISEKKIAQNTAVIKVNIIKLVNY